MLLWTDGLKAYEEGRYKDARRQLQRIVDRYPGHPHYLDTHLILGKTYLELNESAKALPPLQYYIEAAGDNLSGYQGRLTLAKAYLQAQKNHEALLIANQILKETAQIRTKRNEERKKALSDKQKQFLDLGVQASEGQAEAKQKLVQLRKEVLTLKYPRATDIDLLHLHAQLIKAWSHAGLKNDDLAQGVMRSFEEDAQYYQHPEVTDLHAQAYLIELDLKTRACSLFPSSSRLTEEQATDQLKRRGLCLLEAMLLFHQGLKTKKSKWSQKSKKLLEKAFTSYAKACSHPPLPPDHRSKLETKRYRQELAELLEKDFRETREKALELLRGWKKELPNPSARVVDQLAIRIKKTRT